MNVEELRIKWKNEEEKAHIYGWDFSYIKGRYKDADDLPWNYKIIIEQYLNSEFDLLDIDTGGGEFLRTLNHPYNKTFATEGFKPNVELCREKLVPLGIDVKENNNPSNMPFNDEKFDMIINRHGGFDAEEIYRLLKKEGIFITQQVGGNNDRDLIELVLPQTEKVFSHLNLNDQVKVFKVSGFKIIMAEETYKKIEFYDVGAFVWFAHIIEWEFPGFSVDNCFDELINMQKIVEKTGKIEGTIHRYVIVAKK